MDFRPLVVVEHWAVKSRQFQSNAKVTGNIKDAKLNLRRIAITSGPIQASGYS